LIPTEGLISPGEERVDCHGRNRFDVIIQSSVEGIREPQKNPLSLRERVRVREIKY
jgi:hypothetical protein